MSTTQDEVQKLDRPDAFDSYFECITACSWVGGEDVECVTRCMEVHLKKEEH